MPTLPPQALKYHPDMKRDNKEAAEAKFKEISTAYSELSNVQTRHQYDTGGGEWNAHYSPPRTHESPFGGAGHDHRPLSKEEADAMYEELFGRPRPPESEFRSRRSRPRRGESQGSQLDSMARKAVIGLNKLLNTVLSVFLR